MLVASTWLVSIFSGLIMPGNKREFKPFTYFMKINYYVLTIIIFLSLDSFLRL